MLRVIAAMAMIGFAVSTVSAGGDPLNVAKSLAETRFAGWHYGSDSKKQQVDCVQFLLAVVEETLASTLDSKTRDRILISDLTEEEKKPENLAALVIAGDERTKGVQSALIEAKRGTAVSVDDVAEGDLIQYWMKNDDGAWFGHSGVIEKIFRDEAIPRAQIYGAHASPKPEGKIGSSTFKLKLATDDPDRRIYLVRLKQP